jgi:RNA polymerase sigma-70 factor (TIGR02960 family)
MDNDTLQRAQAGEGNAFEELVQPHRRELLAHCYRILGSLQDAEDVLQEALLSAWQALPRFDGQSLRAWLYRIATNRSLNHLRDASRRPAAGNPPPTQPPFANASVSEEPWWLEPYPDALFDDATIGPEARYDRRETIALAFVAGLQRLPPQQRAALLLRDVLSFSAAETADMLETTPASVNSALQRARARFPYPGPSEQLRVPRSQEQATIADQFVTAFEQGDLDAVVALLTDDAKITMPPEPFEVRGRAAIANFYRGQGFWDRGLKVATTGANHQPAFGYYLPDPKSGEYRAAGMLVLAVSDDGISGITRFGDRTLLGRFGLPRTFPAGHDRHFGHVAPRER